MKKLILITLLSIATLSKAQTTKPIDGFLGIKFGSSQAQVKEALKAKGAVQDVSYNVEGKLAFGYVKLGDRQSSTLFAKFVDNQVYEAEFIFRPNQDAKAIEYYNKLVYDISEVYGIGSATKNFKEPYRDGDGYEITAIKSGNADYRTYWTFGENYITAKIQVDKTGSILIRLYYGDGKLFNLKQNQQKEKNKSEF